MLIAQDEKARLRGTASDEDDHDLVKLKHESIPQTTLDRSPVLKCALESRGEASLPVKPSAFRLWLCHQTVRNESLEDSCTLLKVQPHHVPTCYSLRNGFSQTRAVASTSLTPARGQHRPTVEGILTRSPHRLLTRNQPQNDLRSSDGICVRCPGRYGPGIARIVCLRCKFGVIDSANKHWLRQRATAATATASAMPAQAGKPVRAHGQSQADLCTPRLVTAQRHTGMPNALFKSSSEAPRQQLATTLPTVVSNQSPPNSTSGGPGAVCRSHPLAHATQSCTSCREVHRCRPGGPSRQIAGLAETTP